MGEIFGDAWYWIALLHPKDQGHARAVALSTRKLDRFERSYAWGALAFHVVSGFGQEWLHYSYYEFSDMHNYIDTGRLIAKLLEFDFARFSWEVLSLFLHLDTSMPVEVRGDGNPTPRRRWPICSRGWVCWCPAIRFASRTWPRFS